MAGSAARALRADLVGDPPSCPTAATPPGRVRGGRRHADVEVEVPWLDVAHLRVAHLRVAHLRVAHLHVAHLDEA
jgi:hypothetical protein